MSDVKKIERARQIPLPCSLFGYSSSLVASERIEPASARGICYPQSDMSRGSLLLACFARCNIALCLLKKK